MALTITPVKRTVFGDCRIEFADVTFGDYPTGGEPLAAADFGQSDALEVLSVTVSNPSGYLVSYESGSLVVYQVAEVRDADPAGPMVEVDDRTDLSSLTVRVTVTLA